MFKRQLIVVILVGLGAGVANVDAQQAASSAAAAQSGNALEEIVVTAQRREENLQHAAIAVTAITGEHFGEAGAIKLQELTELVPALQVSLSAGPYPLFYLRGVGNFNGDPLSDAAVAISLDGVYIARPSSTNGLFYDLSRVEVLKGPQGTLYGRNATGGTINIITNKPDAELSGDASVEFGNYGTKNITGALNVPFSPTVSARLAVQSTQHDGYLSDGTDDDKGKGARLQVLFEPNDSFKINTSADYFHQGGKGPGATLLQSGVSGFVDGNPRIGITSAPINAIFSQTFYFVAGDTFGPLLDKALVASPLPVEPGQNDDYAGLSATADWKTAAGTLTLIPAYRHSSLDFTSTAAAFLIQQHSTDKQGSFEARFASNTDQALSYIAGVYYLDESATSHMVYDQQFDGTEESYEFSTKSYAGFGRFTYAATDTVRLTGGLRYTDDKKSMHGTAAIDELLCPGSFIPPPAGPQFCFGGVGQVVVPAPLISQSPKASYSDTTWRAGAEWDVAPASLLYAAVETGFKAGGFYFTHDDPYYRPEHITAYSVGSKNRFLDNRLQINGELFYWIYKDQQISHLGIDSTGTVIFPTDNVGSSKMKGAELETQYLAPTETLFTSDIQYLEAVYNDYRYTVPNLGAVPVTACPFVLNGTGAGYEVNCSGKTAPESPRWSINLGVRQTIEVGNGSIVGDLNTHFQTATLTGLEFSALEEQSSYWMSSADLGYHAVKDRWAVVGWINNLANKTVVQGTFPNPLAGAALTAATLRPPRTYGIRLNVKF
jgi:iron complex outermembrane recepter protein